MEWATAGERMVEPCWQPQPRVALTPEQQETGRVMSQVP